jgi:6-pyruvoyltetrahydropterin/6-carboxytetrahydropterin synthase
MKVPIGKKFHFDAAHRLPNHPGLCKHLHGHTYTLLVELSGEPNVETGMLIDFYELKDVVGVILENSDHDNLNNKYPLTTVEFLCQDFAHIISRAFPHLGVTIQLQEGLGGYARCSLPPKDGEYEKG